MELNFRPGDFVRPTKDNKKMMRDVILQYIGIVNCKELFPDSAEQAHLFQYRTSTRGDLRERYYRVDSSEVNDLYERINVADFKNPVKTLLFWNCNCSENHVKPDRSGMCDICGAWIELSIRSSVQEVYNEGLNPATGYRMRSRTTKSTKMSNIWELI